MTLPLKGQEPIASIGFRQVAYRAGDPRVALIRILQPKAGKRFEENRANQPNPHPLPHSSDNGPYSEKSIRYQNRANLNRIES